MKSLNAWKLIARKLKEDQPVILLFVLESKGSSPGRQGFMMAVTGDGEMQGSIGGGIMEHKFVEMAKEQLQAASPELRAGKLKKQIHDKKAVGNQSGMICSGEQTIWIYAVQKNDEEAIKNLIASIEAHRNGTLILSPSGIQFTTETPEKDFHLQFNSEEDWKYQEKTGFKNFLFIIGGGHCALAISELMSRMDFYIHLFEEREELNTVMQNDFAHKKTFLKSYSELGEQISDRSNQYVVIMSFGYRSDDIALRALMHKGFRYIGLLGSKKKIEKMFSDLRSEGIDESLLEKIHAPVGINIKSETPEEIAVSIAAQIISVKNKYE